MMYSYPQPQQPAYYQYCTLDHQRQCVIVVVDAQSQQVRMVIPFWQYIQQWRWIFPSNTIATMLHHQQQQQQALQVQQAQQEEAEQQAELGTEEEENEVAAEEEAQQPSFFSHATPSPQPVATPLLQQMTDNFGIFDGDFLLRDQEDDDDEIMVAGKGKEHYCE